MATTHKYATPESVTTLLSTGLNSLANAARVVSSDVDNATGLYLYADFECNFASAAFAAGAYVSLYLLESIDGTNYEDGSSSVTPTAQCLIANIPFRNATAAQIHTVRGIVLPPTHFEIELINNCGVTLASSGNTLKMNRYNEQDL
jgi:hypothetical protein